MSAIKKFCTSCVGCKIIMALSGIGLVGFLLAHLAGNLLVFVKRSKRKNRKNFFFLFFLPVFLVSCSLLLLTSSFCASYFATRSF